MANWLYSMLPNMEIQYCAKGLGHPVFWLLHKKSYLTQNATNYNEIFTCDREKRYLQVS